jgi:hypothetical protein
MQLVLSFINSKLLPELNASISAVHIRAVADRAHCFYCANIKLRPPVVAAYCAQHFWSFTSCARLLCGRRVRVRGALRFWFVVGVARSRALTTFVR